MRLANSFKKIFLVLPLFFLFSTAQASIEDNIDSVIHYAEQYEIGNIDYLQLRVHTSFIRDVIQSELGEEIKPYHMGLNKETVEEMLGKPTEMGYWAWDEENEEDTRLDEPLPVWKKLIFDGRKIQIMINAWPHVMNTEEGKMEYYWLDFEVKFKKEFDLDVDSMMSEIESLAEQFNTDQSNGKELAEKMVNFERTVDEYVKNENMCEEVLEEIFSSSEKKAEQARTRYVANLYEGKNIILKFDIHTCSDCEWPWVNTWFEPEIFDYKMMGEIDRSWKGGKDFDYEKYGDWEIDDLEREFGKILSEIVDKAKDFDRSNNPNSLKNLGNYRAEMEAINKALDEKYYGMVPDEKREEKYSERLSGLENIVEKYGDLEKISLKEVRYEKRIVENTIEKQEAWCRHLTDVECESDEGCFEGKCVLALGGDEDCFNGVDDDEDNIVDCDDPDCSQNEPECGRMCQSVCEDTCWSCTNDECGSACEECWDCEKDGGDCRDVCEDTCWSCHSEKCDSRCDECWNCEDQHYGSGCREVCKSCWDCHETGDNCDSECQECWPCEEQSKENKCKVECGEDEGCLESCISKQGDTSTIEQCKEVCKTKQSVGPCIELCEQEVTFICNGREQMTPCDDIYYICEDVGTQDVPCMYYICPDGRKQTEPCELMYICDGVPQLTPCNTYICNGQESLVPCDEIECGENQLLDDDFCVCIEGFHDCDDDGNCETEGPCRSGMEICNDGIDNNEDELIDCQDLIACTGTVCAEEDGKTLRCFQGECSPSQGCAKEGEFWGSETGIWECCGGLSKLSVDADSGYCTYCGDGVCKPPEDIWTFDQQLCPLDCEMEDVVCEVDADCDDKKPCTADSCVESVCTYEEITPCCGNRVCEDGETISTCENDCSQQCPFTCCGDCPLGCPENCIAECGNGICEEGEDESCHDDCPKCPVHDLPECPEGVIVFGGEDKDGCPLSPVCITPEYDECETDEDCSGAALCGVAECVENKCKVVELTSCEDPECLAGESKIENCNDGSIVLTAECIDFKWVGTGVECPEVEPEEPGTEEEPEEEEEEPEEEPEVEEGPGEECVYASDCGGPQDVCSNGRCVALPIPVESTGEEPEEEVVTTTEPHEETETTTMETTTEPKEEPEPETTTEPKEEETTTEPEEKPEGEPSEGPGNILGDFVKVITGWVIKGSECDWDNECPSGQFCSREAGLRMDEENHFCIDTCSENEDCPYGMQCDEMRGVCNCRTWEGYHDCDGDYDNGCESEDATCGGDYNACDYMDWCDDQPNRYCDPELGDCRCNEGYHDCDGDWENGCESSHDCESCSSDSDCADDRCSGWGNVIQKFGCYKGATWVEEVGVFQAGGGCVYRSSELDHGYVHFESWGDPFEQMEKMRYDFEDDSRSSWCEWELENAKKKREEIEKNLNHEFLEWFFEDYVTTSPEDWDKHIGGIWDIYWEIVDNNRMTAEAVQCMDGSWQSDYNKIDVEYETNYGYVKIWEEESTTDMFGKKTDILSPYMKIWVFPTKEFIRNELITSMEDGKLPGPSDEDMGPTAADIREMKQDEEFMNFIRELSDEYGGQLDFVGTIVDNGERLYQIHVKVNPDDVIVMSPTFDMPEEVDVKVDVDFDFLYGMIMTSEKEMRGEEVEVPPWERKQRGGIKEIGTNVKMFTKVTGAIASGDIKIDSKAGTIKTLSQIKRFMDFMGEGEREE